MAPRINVALLPQLLPADWATTRPVALVIDTLRFTSTACVAFAAGARALHVVSDIAAAHHRAQLGTPPALLCGERDCVRIAGFHLGNSPQEYSAATVAGRELVFSTTNGTRAVEAVAAAGQVWLACLLNRAAICQNLNRLAVEEAALGRALHVWCVCAGTDGEVATEDVLTAGAVIEGLLQTEPREEQQTPWQLGNDAAHLAWTQWQAGSRPTTAADPQLPAVHASKAVTGCLQQFHYARGGRNLLAAGFADDLIAVAQLDSLAWVPQQVAAGTFQAMQVG